MFKRDSPSRGYSRLPLAEPSSSTSEFIDMSDTGPTKFANERVLEAPNLLVTELALQDTTPWYQKPNLRFLYLVFFPTCIGVEMTSGLVFLLTLS